MQLSTVFKLCKQPGVGGQCLSGRVLDPRPRGRGFKPRRRHCVVSLSKNINRSLVLVQPRKTRPFITERLLMGRKESIQTKKQKINSCATTFRYNFAARIEIHGCVFCFKGGKVNLNVHMVRFSLSADSFYLLTC